MINPLAFRIQTYNKSGPMISNCTGIFSSFDAVLHVVKTAIYLGEFFTVDEL